MKKFLIVLCFSLLITMVLPFGQAPKANTNTVFADVSSSHRAQEEIYYLAHKGIINGVTATQFAPNRELTRGEAAIILGRALSVNGKQRATEFSDVGSGKTSSGYIQSLADLKIISGYGNGLFKPDDTLSRGQMALLISKAYKFNANTVGTASNALMQKGIAQGIADGSFGEQLKIKRSDFAVFIARSENESFRLTGNTKPQPTPTPIPDQFKTKMYVNTGNAETLNFRKGPGVSYGSISKLTNRTVVYQASTTGDWAHIKVGSQVGYVHKNFIQNTLPAVAPAPAPAPPGGSLVNGKRLSDLVVIIDPGHGGRDGGAAGNGFLEKNMVLNIGLKMNKYFEKTPLQTKMTRTGDSFPSLSQRVAFAKQSKGDIFVSIHTNAFNGSANGQETFYFRTANNTKVQQSRALAIYTQYRMQEAANLTNRGVKEGNYKVLRDNSMPAVLAEVGFIDSNVDIVAIRTEAGREKMARGLFLATLDYYYHFEGRQDILPLYNTVGAKPSGKRH